ncbi:MAG: hypothetical protein HY017_14300 [Betaproteobacteria bacterium]|nr:hypothetical protein [Betaproteobacteria bacterium]
MTKANAATPGDIPTLVFESFLQALEASGTSTELIARLRKTLLVDKGFSDKALKEALFPETWDL